MTTFARNRRVEVGELGGGDVEWNASKYVPGGVVLVEALSGIMRSQAARWSTAKCCISSAVDGPPLVRLVASASAGAVTLAEERGGDRRRRRRST
jgi:hypothetical protein